MAKGPFTPGATYPHCPLSDAKREWVAMVRALGLFHLTPDFPCYPRVEGLGLMLNFVGHRKVRCACLEMPFDHNYGDDEYRCAWRRVSED